VRVGFQPFGILWLLRASGVLDRAWSEQGSGIEWTEFATGPALVEAVRAGRLDLGVVGETPPLVAQAGEAPLIYLAAELRARGGGNRRPDPFVRHQRRGSARRAHRAHTLDQRALSARACARRAGLPLGAVELVFAQPQEARVLLESGAADAWAIRDPLLAEAELRGPCACCATRVSWHPTGTFYVGARAFVEQSPELVEQFLGEIAKLGATVSASPQAVVDCSAIPSASLGRRCCGRSGALRSARCLRRRDQPLAAERGRLVTTREADPRAITVADARWVRADS